MKILLTGGSGFIGKNILEQLGDKHEIFAPSHKEVDFTNYEAVKELLKNGGYEAIIHSATKPAHRAVFDTNDVAMTNLQMFTALSKSAAEEDIKKFIYFGSGSEYDSAIDLINVDEKKLGKRIPIDITGYPKYLMNTLAEAKIGFVNLRCFGVFGKYEDYSIRFISNAICRAIFDYSITVRQDRLMSYVYIDDLVSITHYFLQNKVKYKAYNVTSDESWSLLDLARLIRRITAKDVPIDLAKDGKGLEYTGSNKRLKSELNFIFTSMYDAIKMLFNWYIMNSDTIDREKLLNIK